MVLSVQNDQHLMKADVSVCMGERGERVGWGGGGEGGNGRGEARG